MREPKWQVASGRWSANGRKRPLASGAAAPSPTTTSFPTPNPQPLTPNPRSGITLLELLIVMMILLMVTAAAIPVMAPAMRNRQMREATRMVTSYIEASKARALSTGRPAGVQIERFNGLPFAFQISQIEIPPPYAGDVQELKTNNVVAGNPAAALTAGRAAGWPYVWWCTITIDQTLFNAKAIRIGDMIQLGSKGYYYTVYGPDEPGESQTTDGVIDVPTNATDPVVLEVAYCSRTPITGSVFFPWAVAGTYNVPFQVFRQPVRTSTPPMTLPEGLVVDLSVSGVGTSLFNSQDYTATMLTAAAPEPLVLFDPQILFSPSGRVEYVSGAAGQLVRATEPVFLLMGRRELMFDATNRFDAKNIVFQNLSPVPTPSDTMPAPAENFWVTIGPQNGQVTTAQVAPNYQDYEYKSGAVTASSTHADLINVTLNGSAAHGLLGARAFARDTQTLGGR